MAAFVNRAYQSIIQTWEEKKKRYAEGNATSREILEVESEQRLKLIYHILSTDLIEEDGIFDASGDEPVAALSRRIALEVDMTPDFVSRYIRQWYEKGYLGFLGDDERIRWEWMPVGLPLN